ncbi:MAG: glycosyltransferase family 8 protein [Clostridia bacterium]|nr:glycosyltransferase family 8 protein [Clostridia bacterium]
MTNIFNKKEIPLVFAVDDNYAPFLCVALRSIMENASVDYYYKVYVLNTVICPENKKKIISIAEELSDDLSVEYVDVADRMDKIKDKTALRDYYTNTTYFRIFIPALFPQYEKVVYLDSDLIFLDDVSKLYNVDLKGNIFAAIHEEAMSEFDVLGVYSEQFLGVDRMRYFNAGILVINTEEYKKADIENKFINLMSEHKFRVAQDQDYLNVVCKDKVIYLDVGWNKTPIPTKEFEDDDVKVIHYKLNFKPWHYDDVRYQEPFWEYAAKTPYYDELIKMRDSYTKEEKDRDDLAFSNLLKMASEDTSSERNYLKNVKKTC